MDLRQFFESFFRLNEELSSFFDQSMFSGDHGGFFQERGDVPEPGQSPRDMMLKKRTERAIDHRHNHNHHQQLQPHSSEDHRPGDGSSLMDLLDSGQNFFRSSQFEKTFSGDFSGGGSSGMFEEKIVIRNGDGTEKVITKHSAGGRTTHREVTRRDGKIIAESEVVSDIGDDIGKIGKIPFNGGGGREGGFNFDTSGIPPKPNDSGGSRSWSFWNWFK